MLEHRKETSLEANRPQILLLCEIIGRLCQVACSLPGSTRRLAEAAAETEEQLVELTAEQLAELAVGATLAMALRRWRLWSSGQEFTLLQVLYFEAFDGLSYNALSSSGIDMIVSLYPVSVQSERRKAPTCKELEFRIVFVIALADLSFNSCVGKAAARGFPTRPLISL
ncbi:hypothetical protein NliqN6_3192 [Naganishia liquefaciens]|uniref:Uncharacterized protein n=1 Tax=Naganishia liquefaciens TaxID=104408 RepID=A0A8H3TU89_9TREE|nr:hypothetical protein NliqN6_3192 [Naganishia liquefaciens]